MVIDNCYISVLTMSQNVCLVNTFMNQNSLLYVRCFLSYTARRVNVERCQWTLIFSLHNQSNETL